MGIISSPLLLHWHTVKYFISLQFVKTHHFSFSQALAVGDSSDAGNLPEAIDHNRQLCHQFVLKYMYVVELNGIGMSVIVWQVDAYMHRPVNLDCFRIFERRKAMCMFIWGLLQKRSVSAASLVKQMLFIMSYSMNYCFLPLKTVASWDHASTWQSQKEGRQPELGYKLDSDLT